VGKVIHAIVDNYATHKPSKGAPMADAASPLDVPLHPDLSILAKRSRRLSSPSSRAGASSAACSDLSLIYKSPSTVSSQRQTQIPKPFVWTADPKRVLAAVKRGKQTLESIY
jgi:hypothetical protein